jgi:hypothetical protein
MDFYLRRPVIAAKAGRQPLSITSQLSRIHFPLNTLQRAFYLYFSLPHVAPTHLPPMPTITRESPSSVSSLKIASKVVSVSVTLLSLEMEQNNKSEYLKVENTLF